MPLRFTSTEEKIETTDRANPSLAADNDPEYLVTFRREVNELGQRIEKGKQWLGRNPSDVRIVLPSSGCLETGEPSSGGSSSGCLKARPAAVGSETYVALTDRGERMLALFNALRATHKAGMQVIIGEALLRDADRRGKSPAEIGQIAAAQVRASVEFDRAKPGIEAAEEAL